MKLPASINLILTDTIGELGGVDLEPLKTAKPGDKMVLAWIPEKKSFSFINLKTGVRRVKKKK